MIEYKKQQLSTIFFDGKAEKSLNPPRHNPIQLKYDNKNENGKTDDFSVFLLSSNDELYRYPSAQILFHQEGMDMKLAETRYVYSGGRYLILPNTERETKQIWKNNIVRGSIFLGLAFTIGMMN